MNASRVPPPQEPTKSPVERLSGETHRRVDKVEKVGEVDPDEARSRKFSQALQDAEKQFERAKAPSTSSATTPFEPSFFSSSPSMGSEDEHSFGNEEVQPSPDWDALGAAPLASPNNSPPPPSFSPAPNPPPPNDPLPHSPGFLQSETPPDASTPPVSPKPLRQGPPQSSAKKTDAPSSLTPDQELEKLLNAKPASSSADETLASAKVAKIAVKKPSESAKKGEATALPGPPIEESGAGGASSKSSNRGSLKEKNFSPALPETPRESLSSTSLKKPKTLPEKTPPEMAALPPPPLEVPPLSKKGKKTGRSSTPVDEEAELSGPLSERRQEKARLKKAEEHRHKEEENLSTQARIQQSKEVEDRQRHRRPIEIQGPSIPLLPPEIAPIAQAAATRANPYLSPETATLFYQMVGTITLLTAHPGIAKTEVLLNAPSFAASRFFGATITIEKYATAPDSINIRLTGSSDAVNAFNQNIPSLVAAFQNGAFPFRIGRIETSYETSRPVFHRKGQGEGKEGGSEKGSK